MKYNFKKTSKNLKIISASLLGISLLVSGCYGKNINTSELESIFHKNSEAVATETEIYSSKITSTIEPTDTDYSIESITSETVEEQVFKPTATDCADFLEYYIEKLGIEEENMSASISHLSCFLYDDDMNKAFVDFYNEKYGTNFTVIPRLELIERLNGLTNRARPKSDYYPVKEDILDNVTSELYNMRYKQYVQINCLTDEILLSYMAENNLPLGYIFSYEEISQYLPELRHSDNWVSYNVNFDNCKDITSNESAVSYLGYAMMVHNTCLNEFTLESWIDTETFTGEYAELYRDRVDKAISDNFKNEYGVDVNIKMEDIITPEIYEEIYGHEIYDLSPENMEGYSAKEFAKTLQKSR